MAQRTQIIFTDDLDGGEADGTVRFGLDGSDYEIDLSAANAERLRKELAKYISAGRKVSTVAKRVARGSSTSKRPDGPTPSEIRDWAKAQGIEVSDRGRVPNDLIVKFQAAQG
jgi:hypothetical protein